MAQYTRIAELDETASGRAAIVVSELTTNLARHAQGGEVSLSLIAAGGAKWVEVMTVDRGPGMSDVGRCLQDGFSTSGTAGTGLGAVRRLSSEFDIYSTPGAGTVAFAAIRSDQRPPRSGPFQWGSACRSISPELLSGDNWRVAEQAGVLAVMVADGSGHGPEAAAASGQVGAVFDSQPFIAGTEFMEKAHGKLRGSRGAAVAIAHVNVHTGRISYTGTGNIAGHLHAIRGEPASQGLVSHNGIVGVNQRKPMQFTYACPPQALLIMHSDGLRSRWSLSDYPGLLVRHPALIAGVLYRDFSRGRDDLAVVVVRITRPNSGGQT